jgi:hypothetical protein
MKTIMKLSILGSLALGMMVVACGDDDDTTTPTGPGPTTTTSTGGMGGMGGAGGMAGVPAIPALGTQIDRMGRPAINTALNNFFADDTPRGAAEDAWNANTAAADWVTDHKEDVRGGLAAMDSLDTDLTNGGCGTQVGYDALSNTDDYNSLATILTNDWLVVKGNAMGGCSTYLGVEANFLGTTNDDCGGRTPTYDVIETTYSAISGVGLSGFDDGITLPAKTSTAFAAGFPYLAAPN